MKKTSHRILQSEKSTNKMFEEILDIFTGRMKPVSIAFVEQLGLQALESALTKKNDIKAMQFFHKLGYGSNDIKRWSERSPKFKRLYERRKNIIGDKREIGAAIKDQDDEYIRLNDNFIRLSMPLYEEEWDQLEKQRADRANSVVGDEQKVIVIEKFTEEK